MQKVKRLLALAGAILLVIMYLSTLIFSLMSGELALGLFKASIFCTVAVPVMLYAYMLIYRVLKGRGVLKQASHPKMENSEKKKR